MKKIILLLIFSVPLLAVDSIYTWGYGYIFKEILESVKIVTNDNGVMLSSAIAVGGLLTMIKNMQSGSEAGFALIKYMFIVSLIVGMFFEAKKDYAVEDEVTQEMYVVQNVPVGIGEVFSLFTNLERNLAKGFETAFSTPNSISYTNAGIGFAMSAHLNTDDLRVKDTYLTRTFNEYIGNCVISAIINNDIKSHKILNSSDLSTDLKVTGFESIWYDSLNPEGVESSCEDIWDNHLKNKMDSVATDQIEVLAKRAQLSEDRYKNAMSGTSNLLYGIGANAKNYVTQQTLKNMTKDGLIVSAQAIGGDAATVAYGASMAQVNQQQQWALTGILAKDNIPLMKAVMTVLILGIFVLLIILSVVYGDIGHIKMGFTLLFAMIIWTPLAIIINSMFYMILEYVVQPSLDGEWITLVNAPMMSDKIKNYMSFLGYLTASIPVLAYAIVKKSEQGFVNFFSGTGSAAASAASSAASQTSSGNLSLGNTRINMTSIADVNGSHNYLGGNNWLNKQLKTTDNGNSYMETTYNDGWTTKESANGKISENADGTTASISGASWGNTAKSDYTTSQTQSKAETRQKGTQWGETIAAQEIEQMSKSTMDLTSSALNKGMSLSSGVSDARSSTTQNSINKGLSAVVSDGESVDATLAVNGKAGASLTLDSGSQFAGFAWEKVTGQSAKIEGGMSFVGTNSNGDRMSVNLDSSQAKTYAETYVESKGVAYGDNDTLALAMAEQSQNSLVYNNGDSKSVSQQYAQTHQKMEAYTEAQTKAQSLGNGSTSDLSPKILDAFIENSPFLNLSDKVEANDRITDALKNPENHPVDYNNYIKARNEAFGIDTTSFISSSQHERFDEKITQGKENIDNTKITNTTGNEDFKGEYAEETINFKEAHNQKENDFEVSNKIDNEVDIDRQANYEKSKFDDKRGESKVANIVESLVVDGVGHELNTAVETIDNIIPDSPNIKNTQEHDKLVNEAWSKAIDKGLILENGSKINSAMVNDNMFSLEELKMIEEKDIRNTGDLRWGGLSNNSEDLLKKEIEFREKGYNSSDFSKEYKQNIYKEGQDAGLIEDSFFSDGLNNLSKMDNFTSKELRGMIEYSSGFDGLDENAKNAFEQEISRRQIAETTKEIKNIKQDLEDKGE